jgi:hypothetical protein
VLGPPQEGILAFFQDRFVLFLLDGGQWSVNYDALANFKLAEKERRELDSFTKGR